jgi:hypothetical protein
MPGRSSVFVGRICRRGGSIVVRLSQPTVSFVCRLPAEVFLPLDYFEDQAPSRPAVGCSGRTAMQRVETVPGVEPVVEGSRRIRSGERPVLHENRQPSTQDPRYRNC